MTDARKSFSPGARLGILGGGQLGRMLAVAAARLGYHCHVFCPEASSPAIELARDATIASYDDRDALRRFAQAVDVITFEFENIPVDPLRTLPQHRLRPGLEILRICQDRILEKSWLKDLGIAVAPFRVVQNPGDLGQALADLGDSILKTARLGYDGKGQLRLQPGDDVSQAEDLVRAGPAVMESVIDFDYEVSVVAARGIDGMIVNYPPVKNIHRDGILRRTEAPAAIPMAVAAQAESIAQRIANHLDLVGVVAVEMFVTKAGEVLVNELAPRPHNSGHWTLDACAVSQFEQTVRAVMGLPLGSPDRHSDAVMDNLLGDDVDRWRELLAEPGAILHLYGKTDPRPGRKMGHVTYLRQKTNV